MSKWNLPVDPEELQFALQLGNAAATYRMITDNPETKGIDVFDETTEEIQEIRFIDNPINRFGGAIAEEFGQDESKFYSIMNRITSLMRVLSDERAKPYLKEDHEGDGSTMINNALIEVIAKIPISDDAEIDRDIFFREVEELIERDMQE